MEEDADSLTSLVSMGANPFDEETNIISINKHKLNNSNKVIIIQKVVGMQPNKSLEQEEPESKQTATETVQNIDPYDDDQIHPAEELIHTLDSLKEKLLGDKKDNQETSINLVETLKDLGSVRSNLSRASKFIGETTNHPHVDEIKSLSKECSEMVKELVVCLCMYSKGQQQTTTSLLKKIDNLTDWCYLLLDAVFDEEEETDRSKRESRVMSMSMERPKGFGKISRISQKFKKTDIDGMLENEKQQTEPDLDPLEEFDNEVLLEEKVDINTVERKLGLTCKASALIFDSIYNFRDIGGWAILWRNIPHRIKLRQVYRAVTPATGTEKDIDFLLNHLKIKSVVDLRSHKEFFPNETSKPYRQILSRDRIFSVELAGVQYKLKSKMKMMRSNTSLNPTITYNNLIGRYKDYISHCQAQICQVFEVFMKKDNYPILLVCSNGKDRTGVICALLLGLLGLTHENIAKDYCDSNGQIDEIMNILKPLGVTEPNAPIEIMTDLLKWIETRYGSIQQFLTIIGFEQSKQAVIRTMLIGKLNDV